MVLAITPVAERLRQVVLGVAQHAADPGDGILGLAVVRGRSRPACEAFVLASEFHAHVRELGRHVAQERGVAWFGLARRHFEDLTRELRGAEN